MFAVLHLPHFSLQAVLRTRPADTGRPAALLSIHGRPPVVEEANDAARTQGVEPGLTAPQASARAEGLLLLTPDAGAEHEARATLHALGWTLAPTIEDTAPGTCTVDLRGADPERTAAAAEEAIRVLEAGGLSAGAGLARTPLLAWYAARTSPGTVRLVRDEAAFLAPLPLALAEPGPALAGVLALWGLRTLGDLTALPGAEIARRAGAEGLAAWQRARGGEVRPLQAVVPPAAFVAEHELEDPVATLEPLLFRLNRFVERLALELRAAAQAAEELGLELRLEDGTLHGRTFRLPEPTADPGILFRALQGHLGSLRTAAAITALRLEVRPTRPPVRQAGLFETGLRDPHGFAETLARVGAIVGGTRIGTPRLADTHRPDAFDLAPPAAIVPAPARPPLHPPLGPPLRRFRPPLPATLGFSGAGRPPDHLHTARFAGPIAGVRGPWRSSGDWWEAGRHWARTEWDVVLAGGGRYRLIRVGEAWYVEGEYD